MVAILASKCRLERVKKNNFYSSNYTTYFFEKGFNMWSWIAKKVWPLLREKIIELIIEVLTKRGLVR